MNSRHLHIIIIISALSTSSASEPLVFNVSEEAPVGTVVGIVIQRQTASEELRYQIRPTSSSSQYFDLDEVTGELRTAKVLDREELCPYQPFCELVVDVIGMSPILAELWRHFHVRCAALRVACRVMPLAYTRS